MTFQGPNAESEDVGRASLQPSDWAQKTGKPYPKRDRQMPWAPDLVLDAQEWIQRAALHDEDAIKELVFSVAPALLEEVKRLRAIGV